jgi:tritrans,polycis-undecaprenyl-diphosphate synthase [geranylgeranyl-diphosphate specific]
LKGRHSPNFIVRKIVHNRLVYKLYDKMLTNQVRDGVKPEHIAVILDGNRRWANVRSATSTYGHQMGADKVEELLRWCFDLGVRTVTIYGFSTENFQRTKEEVRDIMDLLNERLCKLMVDEEIRSRRVKVRAIGRLQLLPEETQKIIRDLEKATQAYDDHYLNIAVAYGGRAEIIDAMRTIAAEVKEGKLQTEEINENVVEEHLYTSYLPNSEPDLIIRTSGEERLSGFLLWQAAYSELCFMDVYWPDFRRIDLLRAVRTFQKRERRFGA